MADTKISELPVTTTIASPDVAPVVRAGVTMQADVSLFGGPFLSAESVRIDPSGDDATGIVGNLAKPFATTQGAIDALELISPLSSNPIIYIGGNAVGGFTTILPYLTIVGVNGAETSGTQPTASAITGNITMNAGEGPEVGTVVLIVKNCWSSHSVTFNGETSNQELILINSVFIGGVISFGTTGGNAAIHGTYMGGLDSAFSRVHNVAVNGGPLNLTDISSTGTIAATDATDLSLIRAVATNIAASINDVAKTDSFIVGTNSASGTTSTDTNVLFSPANYDFSSLPTSEPTEVGKAWIDTTGGFNILKVHL